MATNCMHVRVSHTEPAFIWKRQCEAVITVRGRSWSVTLIRLSSFRFPYHALCGWQRPNTLYPAALLFCPAVGSPRQAYPTPVIIMKQFSHILVLLTCWRFFLAKHATSCILHSACNTASTSHLFHCLRHTSCVKSSCVPLRHKQEWSYGFMHS